MRFGAAMSDILQPFGDKPVDFLFFSFAYAEDFYDFNLFGKDPIYDPVFFSPRVKLVKPRQIDAEFIPQWLPKMWILCKLIHFTGDFFFYGTVESGKILLGFRNELNLPGHISF